MGGGGAVVVSVCGHVCVSTRVCLRGNVLVLDYWCFLNTYQKFGIANGA